MKMEPNLVLNQIGFKFFVKSLELKVLKIQRIGLKTIPKVPLNTKKELVPRLKVLFEINN
jgi:hypothetical protein